MLVGAMASWSMPAAAEEGTLPQYDGSMSFPMIHGATDPEEFSWEVEVGPEQELRQIDDQHAVVYYMPDEVIALHIFAASAHDATGADVPTSIAVSEGDVITLTVHHRAGNPEASSAPFVYPVSQGPGFEVGNSTVIVTLPPPESSEPMTVGRCRVPKLIGRSLPATRRALSRSGCRLGKVHGIQSKGARVVKQFRTVGAELAEGAKVAISLG